jgi:hypothetical protein
MKVERPVVWFAVFVASLVLLSAYCTDRDGGSFGVDFGDFDELIMQNPPYMLAHFGRMTFPTFWFNRGFDLPMAANPPIHTGGIGLLMSLGFSIYYAEATVVFLLLMLCLAAIVRSVFPTSVKLGLLFSIGFLATAGDTLTLCFGTRPEGEVQAAWFLGLVLLESGRLDNWNRLRLFAGALSLTWASGVHYYAAFAFAGVAVYLVWAIRSLGWREGRGRAIALCAGGCVFGGLYLAFFLVPCWRLILGEIHAVYGPGSVGVAISRHLDLYRAWSHNLCRPAVVRFAMRSGIPLVVFSSAILAAVRSTRGLALAALPLQLFVLLFAWHKPEFYLIHECVLFAAALGVGGLVCAGFALERFSAAVRRAFPSVAAVALGVCLVWGSPMLARAAVSLHPMVHEVEVARAASRRILGPNARVSGRMGAWYASGAAHWADLQNDLAPDRLWFDAPTYFSNLDAAADYLEQSDADPLGTWYSDGTLKLRGFFFGETNHQLRLVYLSARRVPQVVGYVARNGRLFRFQEDPAGDYQVLSAVCPRERTAWLRPRTSTFSSVLLFQEGSPDAGRLMVTILAPRSAMSPSGEIGRGCREISKISGTLEFAHKEALLASLRQDDPPMHFYRMLEQMPGYTGMGLPASAAPPPDAIRLDGILDLSKAAAQHSGRVEFRPGMRVTTGTGLGTFSVTIPVNRAESIATPCWVTFRVQVISGRVGFAAYDSRKGIIARTPAFGKSPQPQTIALRVPDFRSATHIVIFNESTLPAGGLMDIFDAGVLVQGTAGAGSKR